MNKITETLQMDHLLMEALREDISSEDVTTNSVMKEAVEGEVELICKQDGVIAGLQVFERVPDRQYSQTHTPATGTGCEWRSRQRREKNFSTEDG